MSEPMTCPKCGAKPYQGIAAWECGTYIPAEGRNGLVRHSAKCLERQLVQRDERIAALEARIKELEAQRERTATETDALRRAINGVVPTDPRRFEDLDLCVALNNYHDRVEWLPIVRAAGVLSEEGQTLDTRPTWVERAWAVIYAFRALTPEQRARLEEP